MTKKQIEILNLLKDGEDMLVSKGEVYVGNTRTNMRLFYSLNRLMAIRCECETANAEYWTINGTGLSLLENVHLINEGNNLRHEIKVKNIPHID